MTGWEKWWDDRTRLQCYFIGLALGAGFGFSFGMGLGG